jgi:hypothetical protein
VPAAFVATISSSYAPGARFSTACGDSQPLHVAPASSEHSKVAAGSLEEKWKVEVAVAVVAAGPETMVVSGASIVQLWTTGVGSTLPARSIACTRSSCAPTASAWSVCGVVQASKSALSSEHWYVSSAAGVPASLPDRVKVAALLPVVALGPETIVVSGAVVSAGGTIVQVTLAAGSSTRPNPFVACTSKVCSPSSRPSWVCGEVHSVAAAPSSEQV